MRGLESLVQGSGQGPTRVKVRSSGRTGVAPGPPLGPTSGRTRAGSWAVGGWALGAWDTEGATWMVSPNLWSSFRT